MEKVRGRPGARLKVAVALQSPDGELYGGNVALAIEKPTAEDFKLVAETAQGAEHEKGMEGLNPIVCSPEDRHVIGGFTAEPGEG